MAAQTRKRRATVRWPQESAEEAFGSPMNKGSSIRASGPERWTSRRERRPPMKGFRSWVFTTVLLALIGLLLGIMFGGLISA
jgi:hypothetical protein